MAFAPALIYEFGLAITALQVAGTLTEGRIISVPFNAGSYVVSAFHIWTILQGGNLKFAADRATLVLGFQPLVFLLVLPSPYSVLRVPLTFLLEETAAARESSDIV